ncbi:MAG: PA14 domain-containing protein [Kiritimatiellaeota bacterium]|nr:PA14 domain-containing protein [Kiritimatiellota bacterium]
MVGPQAPSSITGTNSWTVETWIHKAELNGYVEIYLAWTPRISDQRGRLAEFRYYADAGIAVEHWAENLPWGRGVPAAGEWHHFVFTRDAATGVERGYVDGRLVVAMYRATDSFEDYEFVVGAAWNAQMTGFQDEITAHIGQVRVHSEALTTEGVVLNYLEERAAYGVAHVPESVWAGAIGTTQAWETAANWLGSVKPEMSGSGVSILNGGTAALTTDAGELWSFSPHNGGLVMSGGASLALLPDQRVNMGYGLGNAFLFDLEQGYFGLPGGPANDGWLLMGVDGGSVAATVGGGAGRAELFANRDVQIGVGGYGTMDVGADGCIRSANGWVYIGANSGGTGIVSVADGGEIVLQCPDPNNKLNVMLGNSGGHGELRVADGGAVRPTGDVRFTPGGASEEAFAEVRLEAGGLIEARCILGQNEAGERLLWLNGGTIRNRENNHDNFLQDLTGAYVQGGGVVFDIISETWAGVHQPLLHDPALGATADGGLVKRGEGLLILYGTNTFTGDITIEEGFVWFNLDALTNWTGMIRMDSPNVGVGLEVGGEVATLLAKIPPDAVGQVMLLTQNVGDTFDFSNHPGLTLGVTHRDVTFEGTYIPYSPTHPYIFSADFNATLRFNETIQDGARVEFTGVGAGTLVLGGYNTYTGGTIINGGRVVMDHPYALGTTGNITINDGGTLKLEAAGISSSLWGRLTSGSQGFIILGGNHAGLNVDLSGKPGLTLGTDQGALDYRGTITPAGGTYRLGGGGVSYFWSDRQGLIVSNLQNDGVNARDVVIQGEGLVRLAAGNTYSGGTSITNRGALFLREDSGLGAVPPAPEPSNIFIDGGVVRSANVWFDVHENRGWEIGPLGAELHPWGGSQMTIKGNLSGTGDITLTDGGTVALGGAANTWTGDLDIRGGAIVQIGYGGNLSWPRDNVIIGNQGWLAVDIDDTLGTLAWSDIFANPLGSDGTAIGLRKRGEGTLMLDAVHLYTWETLIEAGTLKVGTQGAIPSAPGQGNTGIYSVLDLNGFATDLGAIFGGGAIIDSAGGAGRVDVGANGGSATFTGSVAPGITLGKTGTGNQTLNTFGVTDADVLQGTLTTVNPTAPTGAITLADGTTLAASGSATIGNGERGGLTAYYYDLPFTPAPEDFDSLAKINAFIADTPPSLITSSHSAGDTLDFDWTRPDNGNRCRFAPPYDHQDRDRFAICLTGRFLAETAGEYTFGTRSDDGSFIIIDGSLVLENNFTQGWDSDLQPRTGTAVLDAGEHDFTVFFYEGIMGHGLSVYMTPPGVAFDTNDPPGIPQSLLTATALPSRWPALDATGASISLYDNAAVELDAAANAALTGGTFSATPGTLLIKSGVGTQTLAPSAMDMQGMTMVQDGELRLDTTGAVGGLDISAGAAFTTAGTLGENLPLGGNGLIGKYYNIWPPEPHNAFNELDTFEDYLAPHRPALIASTLLAGERLNFWGNGGNFPPPYHSSAEGFQVLWKGRILIPEDDTYTFYTASDDGSMLFIDGQTIVRNNSMQGVTEKSGEVALTAGLHDIAISYYQGGGGYGFMVRIQGGGLEYQDIPNTMLFSAPFDLRDGTWLGAGLSAVGPLTGNGTLALDGEDTAMNLYIADACTFGGGAAGAATTVLFKTGPDTLTLTGDSTAFHGRWIVLEGELLAADGAVLGSPDAEINLADGAVLTFDGDAAMLGKITGSGILRLGGNGTATIGDLSGFTGTIEAASPGQSLALLGGGAPVDASRLAGVGTVMLLDGAVMYCFDPADLPPSLVSSNGLLVLAVTDANKDAWDLDRLTVMAGTTQQVTVCSSGLYGKYYDLVMLDPDPGDDPGKAFANEVQAAFWTVETAEDYLAQQTFNQAVSSWHYGDDLACADWRHPYPYHSGSVNFAIVWRGKIRITETGLYTFGTKSDDNSMVFIDGKPIVSSNYDQEATARSGTVTLTQGLHDIDILFCQQGGGHYFDAHIRRPWDEEMIMLPNDMLVAALPDTAAYTNLPPYTLTAATAAVENAGYGTVEMLMGGTLAFSGLWIDTDAILNVTGAAKIAGPALTVTIPEELPPSSTVLIGDFTQANGLNLHGITLQPVIGSESAKITYRDQKLYLTRVKGTVLILR